MSRKTLPPWVKPALEFGPILAFFVAYVLLKDGTYTLAGRPYSGFVLTTALFIPLFLASAGALWALTGRLSPMQGLTMALVLVFGGLSVALNDERFFKMKPTLLYALFSGVLLWGLWRKKPLLQKLMGEALPLTDEGWRRLSLRFALLFLALALANEAAWRLLTTGQWVSFKTFGLPAALFLFVMTQARLFAAHERPQDTAAPPAGKDKKE